MQPPSQQEGPAVPLPAEPAEHHEHEEAHEEEDHNEESEDDDTSHNHDTDDEEEEDNQQQQYPQHIIPPLVVLESNDPRRMLITPDERRRALAIKQAVQEHPDMQGVSDFMCAQCAIVDGDNLEASMERLYGLQCFKEEYHIDDTVQQGLDLFRKFTKLMPQYHLCFTYHSARGVYVLVYDNAGFYSSRVENDESIQLWLGSTYYHGAIITPDLEAARRGVIMIAECDGYGMSCFVFHVFTRDEYTHALFLTVD